MRNQHVACHACGGRAERMFRGRPVCVDCEDDLRRSEILVAHGELSFEPDREPFLQHRLYHGPSPAEVLTGHPLDFDPE